MNWADRFGELANDVSKLERERDDALCEVARLARENGDLCDRIAELEAELRNGRAA